MTLIHDYILCNKFLETHYDRKVERLQIKLSIQLFEKYGGLQGIRAKRKFVNQQLRLLYAFQKDAYNRQKRRYEMCKRRGNFTCHDRQYIETHTYLNKKYIDARDYYIDLMEAFSNLIDMVVEFDTEEELYED